MTTTDAAPAPVLDDLLHDAADMADFSPEGQRRIMRENLRELVGR